MAAPASNPPQDGAKMPPMMYGCAWKKERTAELVHEAIKAGFRGIDTAAMKRHYDEKLTGDGIRQAIEEGFVKRSDLYIQTKFAPHDDAYANPAQYPTIASQVHASITSSLANLATPDASPPYLDSLVMHSPYDTEEDTLAAWTALETYVPHRIRALGISHATVPILECLRTQTKVPPTIVQNRFCVREAHFHAEVRRVCAQQSPPVKFQAFWTLTGNPKEVRKRGFVREVADGAGVSVEAAWYALIVAAGEGMVVLNGTTSGERMREDLEALERVERWKGKEGEKWERLLGEFKEMVG